MPLVFQCTCSYLSSIINTCSGGWNYFLCFAPFIWELLSVITAYKCRMWVQGLLRVFYRLSFKLLLLLCVKGTLDLSGGEGNLPRSAGLWLIRYWCRHWAMIYRLPSSRCCLLPFLHLIHPASQTFNITISPCYLLFRQHTHISHSAGTISGSRPGHLLRHLASRLPSLETPTFADPSSLLRSQ